MARIYKKIKKKIQPKQKTPEKPKEKVGKDYLLIAIITFTTIVMIAGWSTFTNTNRVLYAMLLLSLSLTYVKRHVKLTELQETWVDRASFASMGLAIALFAIVVFHQFFG